MHVVKFGLHRIIAFYILATSRQQPCVTPHSCQHAAYLQASSLWHAANTCAVISLMKWGLALPWTSSTTSQQWLTCSYLWQQQQQAIQTNSIGSASLPVPIPLVILFLESPLVGTPLLIPMRQWASNGKTCRRYGVQYLPVCVSSMCYACFAVLYCTDGFQL